MVPMGKCQQGLPLHQSVVRVSRTFWAESEDREMLTNEKAIAKIGEHQKAIVESAQKTFFADFDSDLTEALGLAIGALKERKTGKWIVTSRNGVLCSECKSGTRRMPMLFGNPLYKYCPFCGAKMEGKE